MNKRKPKREGESLNIGKFENIPVGALLCYPCKSVSCTYFMVKDVDCVWDGDMAFAHSDFGGKYYQWLLPNSPQVLPTIRPPLAALEGPEHIERVQMLLNYHISRFTPPTKH